MKIEGKKILLISPEAWGKNFVSKHHVAKYLSKYNQVYFLDPAVGSKKNPFGKVDIQSENISDSLKVLRYKNLLPKLNDLPKSVQAKIYAKQARQIQQSIGIDKFDIIWSFDPFRFWNLKWFVADHYIYHTVDVHFSKCFEGEIAASAEIVLLSSETLRDDLSTYNKNIHYVGHAADLDSFKEQEKYAKQIESNYPVVAGLVGHFNSNVDYDLIESIVLLNENVQFVFIGPYKSNNLGKSAKDESEKINKLKTYPNVKFTGSIPSSEIMKWLMSFDINLVLYKEEKRDIIINPHKMMGYFYSGKITVCSWFKEYDGVDNEFLFMTNRNKEIPEVIKTISSNLSKWNSPELMQKRRAFALARGYEQKISEIGELLNDKASI